ncbi:helix-turn-helix domain-containing protein [Flavobacterium sp. HNIBRBA15423]|uniref:helix-turn-helix domain-containing protein n=1 Tax=Flavobacterium sp. HNIBRBA15423 TaxID=3458683 RepID=UPI0040445457
MKLHVKNMVCNRCILVVKSELEKLGQEILSIELGEVVLKNEISVNDKKDIAKQLETFGFEILNDSSSKTIEKIKTILIDLVQNKNNNINVTMSDYLIQNLHQDYSKLSNLFSTVEGISIEKYFINLRIEKVKELIVYDELSLSEIADLLNYSSVAHLSNQFKKVTGFSPSYFKKIKESKRKELDQL